MRILPLRKAALPRLVPGAGVHQPGQVVLGVIAAVDQFQRAGRRVERQRLPAGDETVAGRLGQGQNPVVGGDLLRINFILQADVVGAHLDLLNLLLVNVEMLPVGALDHQGRPAQPVQHHGRIVIIGGRVLAETLERRPLAPGTGVREAAGRQARNLNPEGPAQAVGVAGNSQFQLGGVFDVQAVEHRVLEPGLQQGSGHAAVEHRFRRPVAVGRHSKEVPADPLGEDQVGQVQFRNRALEVVRVAAHRNLGLAGLH
ncbi:MAG: hypothetical protein BWY73_01268 [candidate division TA06 bacterium ADurb.Bin417]|uniref:Uncharacterized protein n=1 Tax=candidate division TA06 bacterium ADurb.Bin417 TaxID=1852828 RepID=A0A1V5MC06_UNCT6|nr:MAG: hypothetical protein BWY73_01268 [candidate division TA06 bacterium ADurb.Bin417]